METIRDMFAMEDDQTSRARISHLTCLSINTVRFYLDNRKQIEEALNKPIEDSKMLHVINCWVKEYEPAVNGGKVKWTNKKLDKQNISKS